ncbi:hypothetical protein NLJ89_g5454 [Agrocybe chaxingu]|uniref:CFEM domain-containing protein n=1 Tax=Agrocybe chaxingu TaxID=84603 RepID=A0A9W8MVK6_9AGAR|nr:hypothetical protein NLJ89_g5454 [Agrocybe chaxingu]
MSSDSRRRRTDTPCLCNNRGFSFAVMQCSRSFCSSSDQTRVGNVLGDLCALCIPVNVPCFDPIDPHFYDHGIPIISIHHPDLLATLSITLLYLVQHLVQLRHNCSDAEHDSKHYPGE